MSTFFIYPLEDHGQHLKQDTSTEASTTLSPTGLSRILEIPLSLLDADTNQIFNNKNTTDQMFWLSTNNTPKSTSSTLPPTSPTESTSGGSNGEVTHSFANRKRSIVKRRKSVLSASFTAQDEMEAIKNDRRATLAALERGNHSPSTTQHTEEEEQKKQKNKKMIMILKGGGEGGEGGGGVEKDNDIFTTAPVLSNGRGSCLLETGVVEKSKFQQQTGQPPPSNTIYLNNSNDNEESNTIEVITPKDSAIDLRSFSLIEQQQQEKCNSDHVATETAKVIDLASSPIIIKTISSLSPPPPSPTLPPPPPPSDTTTIAMKKKSWSPRRMFSSSDNSKKKKKALSSSDISSTTTVVIADNTKFNIVSLFSRTSSMSSASKKSTSKLLMKPNTTTTTETKKQDNTKSTNFNYTRLPIHTERAIYRLSHLKLTNPKRPLCDQVTISNLMFWYLSIISQPQQLDNNNTMTGPSAPTLTKKACRIQIHQRRGGSNKKRLPTANKRIRNHQIGPSAESKAMDTSKQQPRKNTHLLRTNNSSSSSDDGEGFSDDDLSDKMSTSDSSEDEDEDEEADKKKTKTKKYSLFTSSNNWLSSFSSAPKSGVLRQQEDEEDDIPLAMYQKGKV